MLHFHNLLWELTKLYSVRPTARTEDQLLQMKIWWLVFIFRLVAVEAGGDESRVSTVLTKGCEGGYVAEGASGLGPHIVAPTVASDGGRLSGIGLSMIAVESLEQVLVMLLLSRR
jgi:hypothetical protein